MKYVRYRCRLMYADGHKKDLTLSQKELDETFCVWKSEMDNDYGEHELLNLRIRKLRVDNS